VDSEIDLAVVRVKNPMRLPKPIDPNISPKVSELMEIRICGFPFGATLGVGGRNPSITIGKGNLSGIDRDLKGTPTSLRIDGSLNPGNSGGPVVDPDGRLVGISVAAIRGSGIGMAIPAHELSLLLTGRISAPSVLPVGMDGGKAAFRFLVPVVDPLKQIAGISLHVYSGDTPPRPEQDPTTGWKPIPDAAKVDLSLTAKTASGDFLLPAPTPGKPPTIVLQLEGRSSSGVTVYSQPISYRLTTNGVQTAGDAIPLETFQKDIAKYAGQVVVVRGKLSPGTPRRGAVYELSISDDSDTTPEGLVFVANRDLVTQLNELPTSDVSLPARLTLQVGKSANAGVVAARVTQVDLIGRGNRLVRTIPSKVEPKDPLTAMNRNPEKYVGQTLPILAYFSSTVLGREDAPELSLLLLTEKRPENLHFTSSPALAAKLKDPSLQGYLFPARITVTVENRQLDGYGPQIVTVQKIEILDREGNARRTFE
jgi:hypothetical protein